MTSCATAKAYKNLQITEDNKARGDPENNNRVKQYIEDEVLRQPEIYQLKAYTRKPYSVDTKQNMFTVHTFYVFYKNGEMQHTLVFTATPKGSALKGAWMLDAASDVESFYQMAEGNPWDAVEMHGPHGETNIDLINTSQKIVERLNQNYRFFGGAIVRDLAWYHQVWMFLIPPPILAYAPLLFASIHADNCTTAVRETVVWQ